MIFLVKNVSAKFDGGYKFSNDGDYFYVLVWHIKSTGE